MDMISNLPNETLSQIGSFLSAKEASFAMVLSKRWRNLFNIVPDLHFDSMVKDGESFKDFSDHVFALPFNSHIRKFALEWESEEIEPDDINRCLSQALKHGVVDLDLRVFVKEEEDRYYSLPLEVLCKTVSILQSLKSLVLHSVLIHDFDTFLSACTVLEELDIYDFRKWKWSHTLSSPTIKTLSIRNDTEDWRYCEEFEYESITFDTPALTYLCYSDYSHKGYPILNLNSLVEAHIDICYHKDNLSDPINLFNELKNVEILSLTDETLGLIHEFREVVPMFENMSQLILVPNGTCWFGLRVLLQKTPKLKTLHIAGGLHMKGNFYCDEEDSRLEPPCECLLGYSFLLTCRIEVLEMTVIGSYPGEMLHLKQILENLPYLELLKLRVFSNDYDEEELKMNFKNLVLMIPKASSKCKIEFSFVMLQDDE